MLIIKIQGVAVKYRVYLTGYTVVKCFSFGVRLPTLSARFYHLKSWCDLEQANYPLLVCCLICTIGRIIIPTLGGEGET